MIRIVCGVRDAAVVGYMRPIFVVTVGEAMRLFNDEVNRGESEMRKHPADYELYELGLFDEDSGKFENLSAPRLLSRGVDVLLKE